MHHFAILVENAPGVPPSSAGPCGRKDKAVRRRFDTVKARLIQMKQRRCVAEVRVSYRIPRLHLHPDALEADVHQQRMRSIVDPRARSDAAPQELSGPLLASSMWLYLGFIGAALFGAGLVALFDGAPHFIALALAIGGAVAAPLCWLRARLAIDRAPRRSRSVRDASFLAGPEVTRLGRHAQDCAELAAWPIADRTGPLSHR